MALYAAVFVNNGSVFESHLMGKVKHFSNPVGTRLVIPLRQQGPGETGAVSRPEQRSDLWR